MADAFDGLKPTADALEAVAAARTGAAPAPTGEVKKGAPAPEAAVVAPGDFATPGKTTEFIGGVGDTAGVKVTVTTH